MQIKIKMKPKPKNNKLIKVQKIVNKSKNQKHQKINKNLHIFQEIIKKMIIEKTIIEKIIIERIITKKMNIARITTKKMIIIIEIIEEIKNKKEDTIRKENFIYKNLHQKQ